MLGDRNSQKDKKKINSILLEIYAEEKKTNKMRMTWEVILGLNMILLVLFSVLFASFVKMETNYKIALITVFCCFVLISIIGLVFLAYYIGYYDCKIYHKSFIPSLKDYLDRTLF